MVIKSMGLDGNFYIFRWKNFDTFPTLDEYLQKMFDTGQKLHEQFLRSANRVSSIKEPILEFEPYKTNLPLCAKESITFCKGKPHTQVQKYLMQNDMFSLATEVPFYYEKKNLFGHIDLLRFNEKDQLEIWDFKKHLNKNVSSQLFWYGYILCDILKIDIGDIMIGYFTYDEAWRLII